MGFYTSFKDPEARAEIVRYYTFLRRHQNLYRANRSYGEALLLFPRSRVHDGDVAAVARFKESGKRLLDDHVLFDILPDDLAAAARLPYQLIFDAASSADSAKPPAGLSRFAAPKTVRISASQPATANEVTLHFVNYNREEPADKKNRGKGIADEKPIAAPAFDVDFKLPGDFKAQGVEFLSPEHEEARQIEFKQDGGRLRFRMPEFLVYGVARVQSSSSK
jgi:hypothetical protein